MNWIKDSFTDLLFLISSGVLIYTQNQPLYIILWIYTGLLLVSKIAFFFIGMLQSKASKTSVPDWFYHVLYGGTILILALGSYYYLTIAWVIIWGLSFLASRKKK
ncbi:MAG TPA: hypothetical protein DEQ34_11265 [Balneolaceae bacterium]|nr:hypothetical protein [Balneolaceae bacterium]|tara:strand:- start:111826 stop:112140 length:315 start_codon:yes stop_codon:yes gene_type:complete